MSILNIVPGDIVREVATARERVVTAYRPDLGLIAFEDSHLQGWVSAEGWVHTGRKADEGK
jgi:hypothetical protein